MMFVEFGEITILVENNFRFLFNQDVFDCPEKNRTKKNE